MKRTAILLALLAVFFTINTSLADTTAIKLKTYETVSATKNAAHKTAEVTKEDTNKVVTGTKNAAHKTAEVTKNAADKTVTGTKNVAHKTADVTKKDTNKVVTGTKNAAHKTAEVTKNAADKTVTGTKNAVKNTKGAIENLNPNREVTLEELEYKAQIKTLKNEKKEIFAAYTSRIKDTKAKINAINNSGTMTEVQKRDAIYELEKEQKSLEEERDNAIKKYNEQIAKIKEENK
ncbi:hypothetical protein II906_01395 [bacterium]|nr:hypothetical protein [bacterium]